MSLFPLFYTFTILPFFAHFIPYTFFSVCFHPLPVILPDNTRNHISKFPLYSCKIAIVQLCNIAQ